MTDKERILLLAQAVHDGVFPGAVALMGSLNQIHFQQVILTLVFVYKKYAAVVVVSNLLIMAHIIYDGQECHLKK